MWKSVIGLGLPAVATLVFLPRVVREATVTDWLIMVCASLMTYASRVVTPAGVSHFPWYLVAVAIWGMTACLSNRTRNLPSIPMAAVFMFLSLLIADMLSAAGSAPEGMYAAPGGAGLMDGLVLRPASAVVLLYVSYWLKAKTGYKAGWGKPTVYFDQESKDFLLSMSPWYRRSSVLDGELRTIKQGVPASEEQVAG